MFIPNVDARVDKRGDNHHCFATNAVLGGDNRVDNSNKIGLK